MAKRRIGKLEKATKDRKNRRELEELFMSNVKRLRAIANGETPPPEHPRASDAKFENTFLGPQRLADGGPVPDLSE